MLKYFKLYYKCSDKDIKHIYIHDDVLDDYFRGGGIRNIIDCNNNRNRSVSNPDGSNVQYLIGEKHLPYYQRIC